LCDRVVKAEFHPGLQSDVFEWLRIKMMSQPDSFSDCSLALNEIQLRLHKLQPFDDMFFIPLQTYHDRFIERWLKSHQGRLFTEYQLAQAFREAYGTAATVEIATNAFRKCGICSKDFSER